MKWPEPHTQVLFKISEQFTPNSFISYKWYPSSVLFDKKKSFIFYTNMFSINPATVLATFVTSSLNLLKNNTNTKKVQTQVHWTQVFLSITQQWRVACHTASVHLKDTQRNCVLIPFTDALFWMGLQVVVLLCGKACLEII